MDKKIRNEKIKELTKEGKNSIEISSLLSLNKKTVRKIQKELGINYTVLHKQYELQEKKCLCCDNTFIVKENSEKKFCNRSCSATYNNLKKSGKSIDDHKKPKISKYDIEGSEKFSLLSDKIKHYWNSKILNTHFEELGWEGKKKYVKLEQNNCCNRCGLDEWQGENLVLEVEHIDGNNKNNVRTNLEGLCPNCHSLTKTWRGKNRKDLLLRKKHTSEDLVNAYLKHGNVHKALNSLGLAAKGGNYPRMYDSLRLAGIEIKIRRK